MSSAVDRLAAQILRLERNVRALSVTPQLAHSSIEDGGSVNSNNADGTTMAQYGGQFDGSYMAASLVGPTPPTPSAPIVTAAIGGLTVRWDGTFTDATFAPMDFTRVEFQVSTDAGFDALSATTLAATVETPRGAELFIPRAPGTYYVAFVARSQSGAAGPKSVTVGPTVVTTIGNDALTNMVAPASVQDSLSGFAIPTPSAVVRAKTLTVPDGITSALVTVTVRVFGVNSTSGLDSLGTSFQIGGAPWTWNETVTVGAGGLARTIATHTDVLTLLTPGSTFDIAVTAGCTAGWAASALNAVQIDGYVLWFR